MTLSPLGNRIRFIFVSIIGISMLILVLAVAFSPPGYSGSAGCDSLKTNFEIENIGSREVSDSLPTPYLILWANNVHKDGHHLMEAIVSDFEFAPERVGSEHRDGEGHLVWYLDGVKQGEVLSKWWRVNPLPEGEHSLVGILTSNDQKNYTKNDKPICAEIKLYGQRNTN